jgi:hypothetical protein
MIPSIDQVRFKRARAGLRACDPMLTAGGYTLFTPLGGSTMYLIDIQGCVSHAKDGDVVWEYDNPFFDGPSDAQTNWVFRAYRYTEQEIARARLSG